MRPQLPEQLQRLTMLWARYAPERKFLGMSLADLQAKVLALDEHRLAMKDVDIRYTAMIATREALADELNQHYQRITSIIWGDEEFGPNSEFHRGLGYKTITEYRAPKPPPPTPPPDGSAPENPPPATPTPA